VRVRGASPSTAGLLAGVALAALLLGPLLGPGFVLVRDMVFVPRLPLTGALLGLDGVPRAVPSDLVVALASRVVPGGWVQDLVLLAVVVGGAWGAARLVPSTSRAAALTAATAYGWSAYLHERLLLGQWALLVGWAVLPWAVRAALAWRWGGSAWPAVAWLGVAALGGASSGLLVGLAVVLCGRPLRAAAATAAFALPWAVPALLAPDGVPSGDPYGVTAFAARSDSPLGLLGSLLTGGGVWAPAAVPPGRSAGVAAAVLVVLLAAAGVPRALERLGPRPLAAAGVGLLLALLGRLPLLSDALRWAVQEVPAAGLLRDGQKWLAPLVLLTAVAAGLGLEAARERLSGRARAGAAFLAVAAPLAALPGAAWGEGGRLSSERYPAGWERVAEAAGEETVLVLPWRAYLRLEESGGRTVLNPAPRWLRGRAVVDDDLPLSTEEVRGEDPLADRLDAEVTAGGPLADALRREGVPLVLVVRESRGLVDPAPDPRLEGLDPLLVRPDLELHRVPGAPQRRPASAPVVPVLLADGAALVLLVVAGGRVVVARRAGYSPES
jgi:hypothetical protein